MNLNEYKIFFDLTFSNSSTIVLMFLAKTKEVVLFNKSAIEFYGYPEDEFRGLTIDYIDIVPQEIIAQRMDDFFDQKKDTFEIVHRTKFNDLKNVIVEATKVELDNEVYILSIIKESSKNKNLIIKDSEFSLLNTIINSTNTGIMLIESATHIIRYINNYGLDLIKSTANQVIGTKCHRFVCPAEENCCPITDLCHSVKNDEKELISSDGSRVPIIKSVSTIKINDVEYLVESFVDISDRKELEKKVKDAETRWRKAINSTGAGLWDWNVQTGEVYLSSSWKSMLGYNENEIENKLSELETRVHPDDIKGALNEINKHFINEVELYSSEHRVLCKDGTYKWVLDKGRVIEWDNDGKPARMIGMHIDINKLKDIEAQLKISEESYRALFQSLPVGVTVADEIGQILETNEIATELLGLTSEQMERRKVDGSEWKIIRLDGTEMPPEEYASVRALKENQTIKNVEMGVVRASDDVAWLNVNATPIENGVIISFEDITERINVQKSLAENENNFRAFFESIDDVIIVADLQGYIIFNNSILHKKLGYSSEEVVGKHILDLHQSEKAEEANQILSDMFAGIRDYCPLPLQRKDGSILPVETRIWMGTWNGKECLYGISKDISKQQFALEKFERVFNNNPAVMALSDLEKGVYLEINEAFTKVLGFGKEELVGKKIVDLNLFKDLEDRKKIIKKVVIDGKFRNEIIEVIDKSGNIKFGNFSGEILDNQGEKTLLTVMIDVTEEINQKQEIESFFSVSLDLLCITDLNGKLLKINNAWEDFLQMPKDQIINSYLANYVNNGDLHGFYSAFKVLNDGESLLSYVNRLHSDAIGGERYFEWRAIPIGNKIYAAGRDITERIIKETENNDLLEQVIESKDIIEATLYQKNALIEEIELSKQKLEDFINEKNDLIGELEKTKFLLEHNIEEKEKFFSIIAHDLKSPFSGFLGLTKILSEDIYDLSMREMQEFANALKLSADNLYKLLENLLEWSRVKRGLVGFHPESIKLNDILNLNINLIKSKATLKNITIINYVIDYIGVSADENMLNAILRNLLSNALKFTPHNGKIVLDAISDGHRVVVSIQDSGIGIPASILDKLFTIGEKISRPGTDGESSTGLGLALCKEYIDLHHGKIWAESKPEHGATFYFTLKLK